MWHSRAAKVVSRVAVVACAASVITIGSASPGFAWNQLDCPYSGVANVKWGTTNADVRYYNYATGSWATALDQAANLWNNAVGPANLTKTTTTSSRNMEVRAETTTASAFWTGVTRKASATGAQTTFPGCTFNLWTSKDMEIVLNIPLMNSLGYSSTQIMGVAAHEFGHAFGLAHNSAVKFCSTPQGAMSPPT